VSVAGFFGSEDVALFLFVAVVLVVVGGDPAEVCWHAHRRDLLICPGSE
jgi:hypothetical protein